MIPAPEGLVASYSNGDERPIHAWDDGGYPLVTNKQGKLVHADSWPGFTGVEQHVDDSPTMAVPGQGWQVEFSNPDGDVWRSPVVAFAIDYTGFAAPLAQEEDGGSVWAIDLNETRPAGHTVRLIPPDVPQPAPRPNTAEEIATGKVNL